MREIFSDTFVSRFHGERISRHIKFAIIRIFVNFDLTLIFFFVFLKLIFELPRVLIGKTKSSTNSTRLHHIFLFF